MRRFLLDPGKNLRALVLVLIYTTVLIGAFWVAYELRFDFNVPFSQQRERLGLIPIIVAIQLPLLVAFRQMGTALSYFGIPDLVRIVTALGISGLILFALWSFVGPEFAPPRGVILIDFVLTVGALCSGRLAFRLYRERLISAKQRAVEGPAQRIGIVGAGDVGASLASQLLGKSGLGLRPVVFFDDDRKKHGTHVHGIPVIGLPEEIGEALGDFRINKIVIAMPAAPAQRMREVIKVMTEVGLKVETVPAMEELTTGKVKVTKIRPVELEDLLGRAEIELNSTSIAEMVRDRIVMVTGAGGSIGAELCRQIANLNPQRLLLVEQSEGNLFLIEQELIGAGYGGLMLPLVADILDTERMLHIFAVYSPQVIFHAAAHKHVPLMERQPSEAVKNNATGTRLLAEMASRHGVERFVLISTDKAINPTSVMGVTKRLAEIHLQATQKRQGNRTAFIAVRFGNVLGSSGSVIPTFKRQIAEGGPVTVTHPDVTRYFMTIPEAVGLVLQAATLGTGGEIFVLDMGRPLKIVDVARQLILLSGLRPEEDIEIKFVGLRPGEKLFEELQHDSEQLAPTTHERIMRFVCTPPDEAFIIACVTELEAKIHQLEANQVKLTLKKFVPEYSPYLD